MRLFEYQGKLLFQNAGIKIPKHYLVASKAEIDGQVAQYPVVAKVQTLGPGRGEHGGVQKCSTSQELHAFVDRYLQAPFRGEVVKTILVEEFVPFVAEHYFALRINPILLSIDLVYSEQGGNGIEARAKADPGAIKVFHIDPCKPFRLYEAIQFAKEMGFSGEILPRVSDFILKMVACFRRFDAKMLEINPVGITADHDLIALDAIVQLDDDAGYRQNLGAQIGPITEEKPREATARERAALNIDKEDYRGAVHYIDLVDDGDIGLLSVGSGFSITVMDILQNYGIKPANFCDCSGNPSKEKVARAAGLILGIPNIKAFLFISGMVSQPLDESARGLVMAVNEIHPTIPIFVRMAGNQEDAAVKILKDNGIANSFSRKASVEEVIQNVKACLSL